MQGWEISPKCLLRTAQEINKKNQQVSKLAFPPPKNILFFKILQHFGGEGKGGGTWYFTVREVSEIFFFLLANNTSEVR